MGQIQFWLTQPSASVTIRAAQQLSPEHRTALEHLYFRDQSLAQAAAELGVPRNTVRSRAYHALRALRAAMKPPAEGDQT